MKMGPDTATLGHSLLADHPVSKETLHEYARRLEAFWDCMEDQSLDTDTPEDLDRALASYCNKLYAEGEPSHEGEKLKAAIGVAEPDFSRSGALGLPRMMRALGGGRRPAPP